MKKIVHLALVFLLVCMTCCMTNGRTDEGNGTIETSTLKGNLIMHNSYADFSRGTLTDTAVLNKGNGVIELQKKADGTYPLSGTYESPEIESDPFEYMVLSWNTDTPYGTSVKIESCVRVNGRWSMWLWVGTWSSSKDKTSSTSSEYSRDEIAYVDTDIVTIRGSSGETSNCFRYRLTLMTDDKNVTPTVRLISATFRNTLPGQEIKNITESDIKQDAIDAFTGTLDVKPYSQMVRDPQYRTIICSAASSCMILDYKGVHILPEMAAMGVLDTYYDGYGNWPFNAAFIASYGFESYIEYCTSLDDITRELIMGNPVICSVRYKRSSRYQGNLPIITNGAINSTFGHLLVVVGYERNADGRGFFVVNDPAADNDEGVRLLYDENQFLGAWNASGRIAYKTHGKLPDAGNSAPVIEEGTLVPTGNVRQTGGVSQREYRVVGRTSGTVSVAKAVNPNNPNFETGVSIIVWDDARNAVHSYIRPTNDTTVWLEPDQANKTVYIFLKTGRYYRTRV